MDFQESSNQIIYKLNFAHPEIELLIWAPIMLVFVIGTFESIRENVRKRYEFWYKKRYWEIKNLLYSLAVHHFGL